MSSVPPQLKASSDQERYIATPIKRHDIWKFYKNMVASFWTVEEVDLSKDRDDFAKISPQAQECIKSILSFFAVADGVVVSNLMDNFTQEVDVIEGRFAYATQGFMETIHSEMYSVLLETLVPETSMRTELLQSATESPHITAKTKFCEKYMNDQRSFAERLVAFTVVEGIMFSSSFAFIYWLKTKGLMPGLTFSNELIARDEGMHRDFGVLLYNQYCLPSHGLPSERLAEIVREGVDIEKKFVHTAIKDGLLGLSAEVMCQYVEFVADHLLSCLNGIEPMYKVKNPLQFMELISLQGKTNFFEKRVGEYAKPNVAGGASDKADNHKLTFVDTDF